jgi:glycosyltransferase involved in cell wall biosynthesis
MNPAKLTTIHIGIPDCSARAGACAEAPVITMVARFCVPKDHALLLSAFAKLPSGPRLRLIGDGPLRRTCEQLADRLGIADRIEWLCDCTDVRTLLAESDVFVLTSRSEMLPVSILEAMCAALPVVASDVGGISEAVEHGQTGWLVPPDSESALRGALLTLLGDRDLRRRLGEAGRRRFEERFASHVQQQRMHNLYLDVLIRRPQADPKARRYAPAVPTYGDD